MAVLMACYFAIALLFMYHLIDGRTIFTISINTYNEAMIETILIIGGFPIVIYTFIAALQNEANKPDGRPILPGVR